MRWAWAMPLACPGDRYIPCYIAVAPIGLRFFGRAIDIKDTVRVAETETEGGMSRRSLAAEPSILLDNRFGLGNV